MNTSAVEQSGLVARFRHIFTALPVAAILLLAIVFGPSSVIPRAEPVQQLWQGACGYACAHL